MNTDLESKEKEMDSLIFEIQSCLIIKVFEESCVLRVVCRKLHRSTSVDFRENFKVSHWRCSLCKKKGSLFV